MSVGEQAVRHCAVQQQRDRATVQDAGEAFISLVTIKTCLYVTVFRQCEVKVQTALVRRPTHNAVGVCFAANSVWHIQCCFSRHQRCLF